MPKLAFYLILIGVGVVSFYAGVLFSLTWYPRQHHEFPVNTSPKDDSNFHFSKALLRNSPLGNRYPRQHQGFPVNTSPKDDSNFHFSMALLRNSLLGNLKNAVYAKEIGKFRGYVNQNYAENNPPPNFHLYHVDPASHNWMQSNALDQGDVKSIIRGDGWRRGGVTEAYVLDVLARGVPGDFVECGVWWGAMVMIIQTVLKLKGLTAERRVFAFDSFKGIMPSQNITWGPDLKTRDHWGGAFHVNSLEAVTANFRKHGLLDDNVNLVPGWFKDTLPAYKNKIEKIALLRVDGDLYESTFQILEHLYDLVAVGGVIILDDWKISIARNAVIEFRKQRGITTPMQTTMCSVEDSVKQYADDVVPWCTLDTVVHWFKDAQTG